MTAREVVVCRQLNGSAIRVTADSTAGAGCG